MGHAQETKNKIYGGDPVDSSSWMILIAFLTYYFYSSQLKFKASHTLNGLYQSIRGEGWGGHKFGLPGICFWTGWVSISTDFAYILQAIMPLFGVMMTHVKSKSFKSRDEKREASMFRVKFFLDPTRYKQLVTIACQEKSRIADVMRQMLADSLRARKRRDL